MKSLKVILLSCTIAASVFGAGAASPDVKYVDGAELTLINKTIDTPRRYARIDTLKYDGFTDYQRKELVQQSAGLALCFKTDSKGVRVKPVYQMHKPAGNQTGINTEGFDLYIKKNDRWLYAGSHVVRGGKDYVQLVDDMAPGEKECLLYLPNFSIVDTVYVGVDADSKIEPMPNPFRHKVVVFGSSFTHGTCCSRPGMSYPLQLERETGIQFCNLGMSGNSRLQQSYARVLADTETDAFLFDSFSNPLAPEIAEKFDSFLATIRAKHPTTPIISMQTIYRENRNFDTKKDRVEAEKMAMAEKKVAEAMKTDKNIYWLVPTTGGTNDTSVDGIHPNDYGHTNWMNSLRRPLLEILAKYNIK